MTDLIESCTNKVNITISFEICSKQGCTAESMEISDKDVRMMIHMQDGPSSTGPRIKPCQEGDRAQQHAYGYRSGAHRTGVRENCRRSKEGELCDEHRQTGKEEEEQCRCSRHSSRRTGMTRLVEEEESHWRLLYSTRHRRYSLEKEQEQCRWRCCEEVYNHTFLSQMVEWILIHSTHTI